MLGNFPNPFNAATTLNYQLGSPGLVKLDLFDVGGQHIRTLVNSPQLSGSYAVNWDGRDDNGKDLATGIYFSRLLVGKSVATGKLLLLK